MDSIAEQAAARESRYEVLCAGGTDISDHLPTLYRLASECDHVTEMGTRAAVSTAALIRAQPGKVVCYDLCKSPEVGMVAAMAGQTKFVFHTADVRLVEIEETDLLFIDTLHTFAQLREELRLHAGKARNYIVFHDTVTFGERGEDGQTPGLLGAIREFLAEHPEWQVVENYLNCNGLMVWKRSAF